MLYLYRWPDGSFSAVAAPNKPSAVDRLDQFGNAEESKLIPFEDFMVTFRPESVAAGMPRPGLALEEFGEATESFIWEFWPHYSTASIELEEADSLTSEQIGELQERLKDALENDGCMRINLRSVEMYGAPSPPS